MKKLKLYLETSVWNFYSVEDSPDKQAVTKYFFDSQPYRRFELYISEVVLEEIKRATTPKREQLLQLIDLHQPKVLALDTTVHQLANAYLAHQILPAKSGYDAQHIAIATVYELDVIVSWNLRHIANLNRQRRVQAFNFTNGYNKPLVMLTPIEVTDDE